MAVACAQLGSTWADTTDQTSHTTSASWTPTANRLLLMGIVNGSNVTVSSVSAFGLTWANVNGLAPAAYRGELWWALTGSSPGSGTATIVTSAANSGMAVAVWELSGTDLTSPIVQSNTASSTTSPISVTLSAFANSSNGTFGMLTMNGNVTFTAGSGFTGTTPFFGFATPTRRLGGEFQATADTTVDATLSAVVNAGIIGVEIKIAGGTTVTGAAALSGAGALTATGKQTADGAATASGAGALTASGKQSADGAAVLSGTGALSAFGAVVGAVTGSGSTDTDSVFSGTGRLEPAAGQLVTDAEQTGVGNVATPAVEVVVSGSGAVIGPGTINGAAALSGAGALTAAGKKTGKGAAVLAGAGGLVVAIAPPQSVLVVTEALVTTLGVVRAPATTVTRLEAPRTTLDDIRAAITAAARDEDVATELELAETVG